MIVGVTEILEYLRCRRRWHLGSSNGLGIESIVPKSPALPLGTALHEALKAWAQYPNDDLVAFYKIAATQLNDALIARYIARVGAAPSSDELDKVHEALLLGESMMANYQAYWGAPLPDGFELVAPEQEVKVPIPGTEHTPEEQHTYSARESDGIVVADRCSTCGIANAEHGTRQPHYLRGRLDGIIIDTNNGLLYDMDHKSYANRPRIETLQHSQQFVMYAWMLHQLKMGQVGGIAYDGMWKRAAPPRGSEVKDLFTRLRIEHTPHQLAECGEMLKALSNEMASSPALTIHRTWDGACEWGCQYNELCIAMSRGDDWRHILSHNYGPKPAYVETETARELA